jgi:hypothetical protein
LSLETDRNKQCNLAICLMHMNRIAEAKSLLQAVRSSSGNRQMDESYANSFERALQILTELESSSLLNPIKQEEGNQNEIQRSFTSLTNRNSKEVNSFTSGGQHCHSAGQWADGHDEKTVLVNERHRGSNHQGHIEDSDFLCGNGSQENVSFGLRSSLQSSPQTISVDNRKKGPHFENPGERMSSFTTRVKDNWVSSTGTQATPTSKNTSSSYNTAGKNLNVLFTQPRRPSWGFNNGYQRSKTLGGDTFRSSSRKLSFESSITTKNVRSQAIQDVNGDLLASPSPAIDQGWFQSSEIGVSSSEKAMTTCEEYFRKNNPDVSSGGLHQPTVETPQPAHDNFKKSWADMVEEEEQELVSGRTLTEYDDGANGEEEFNDENLNSNIIRQSPCPQSQIKSLSCKFESFDLEDRYGTSGAGVSSRNLAVQRSLCFDQHQKPESTDYFCSSPSEKKALDFGGYNSVKKNGGYSMPGENKELPRRNRLQVFRNITLHPKSP